MDYLWIIISIFAALMQAVRTAAQKNLNQRMSNLGTTYVRSAYSGLPPMLAFLAFVLMTLWWWRGQRCALDYLLFTAGGAAAQIFATMALIYMFKLRNFAIGTMLTKVDILMTAIIGTALFSETLSTNGVFALLVVVAGVLLMTVGRMGVGALAGGGEGILAQMFGRSTQVAFLCALLFTFSYLFLREALLTMEPADGYVVPEGIGAMFWRGGWTVVIATLMQTVVVGTYLWFTERGVFREMQASARIGSFIGATSAIGSIGWYTAFAMQNASYVRAVGQIEVVFTLLIAWFYFRERITMLELGGVGLTVAGILMFRLMA